MEDRQMYRKNLDHQNLLIALYHLSYWSQVEEKYFVDNVYYLSQLCVPLLKLVKYPQIAKANYFLAKNIHGVHVIYWWFSIASYI